MPQVDAALERAWAETYNDRYRRATALHEAGHGVVSEILFPVVCEKFNSA